MGLSLDDLTSGARVNGLVIGVDVEIIAVDISATSSGFDEQTMRAVRENANQLKFTGNDFSN